MGLLVNIITADEGEIDAIGASEHPAKEWSGIEAREIDTEKLGHNDARDSTSVMLPNALPVSRERLHPADQYSAHSKDFLNAYCGVVQPRRG